MSVDLNELPGNERTFVCGHLARLERRVLYVFRDTGGELQMVCGQDDCNVNDVNNCKVAGLAHLIEFEPSLSKLTNLPLGHEAWHDPDDNWVLTPISPRKNQ